MIMQREIKFRGKTTGDTGAWVIGYYHFDKQYKKHYICLLDTLTRHEVIGYTVGQYVGLKDRKGADIYEGDILKSWYSRDMSGTDIVYTEDKVEHEIIEGVGTSGYTIEFLHNAEIVGNIHDNPFLQTK